MKMETKKLDREATIGAGGGHELDSVLTIKGRMYPNCWRTDAAFRDDALTLAWFLRSTLPAGVLDALPKALADLRQRQADEINAREQAEFEAGQRPRFTPTIQLKDKYDAYNSRQKERDNVAIVDVSGSTVFQDGGDRDD